MSHAVIPRGYGTQATIFSGNAEDFERWTVRFKGMLRLKKLHTILQTKGNVDADKNTEVFAHLVQHIDNKSLNLVIRDAPDDGRNAFKILEKHYLGANKSRIIALYTELTTLKKSNSETVTEYVLRAETAAARLKAAKKKIQ